MMLINLRQQFGRRFRIAMEESYRAQYGPNFRGDDPHYQIIPGARGHVYAWDANRLAASTVTTGSVTTRLKALPGIEVWQDGSDGCTVLFNPGLLEQVAELLKLRRRRSANLRERNRLRRIGEQHRFRHRQDGIQRNLEARPCVPEVQAEQGHLPA